MQIRICPSAREHLIRAWMDASQFHHDADAYILDLLSAVKGSVGSTAWSPVCSDFAEDLLFVRCRNHLVFLRVLGREEIGVVAVLNVHACAGHNFNCAHAQCQRSQPLFADT